MLAHKEVWGAIDSLATRQGMSPSGLARRSGLDPTTFNRSKRHALDGRPRWPSTESIAKILRATNTSTAEFFGHSAQPVATREGLSIPLLGEAHAGFDIANLNSEEPILLPMPARIINFPDSRYQTLYALSVVGDSMNPIYRNGDVLFIAPNVDTGAGDRVVVKLKTHGIVVKVLKSRDDETFSFEAVGPEQSEITFMADTVDWIARIVYASQ